MWLHFRTSTLVRKNFVDDLLLDTGVLAIKLFQGFGHCHLPFPCLNIRQEAVINGLSGALVQVIETTDQTGGSCRSSRPLRSAL